MKKTLTILLVTALAISTVIGGAVVAKNISTDKVNQTPTQVATSVTATEKSAETQKSASAQTQNAKADTKEADTNKADDTSNAQTSVQDENGMSVVGACYRNMSNPDHCSIEINNMYGNTLDFTITSSNENYSHIATAKVTVTFDDVDDYGVPYGVSKFEYTDSFGNSGTGEIDFNAGRIILTINETDNAGSLWSIGNASGKFL